MPRTLPVASESDYLIQVVNSNSHTEWQNSAGPDQLASEEETKWSGSTLFANSGCIQDKQDQGWYREIHHENMPI